MPAKRPFSIKLYLLIILILSWPFQLIYLFLGDAFRPLLLISMVAAGVGTYLAGKYVFKDGFAKAGWSWGKPKHYLLSLVFALGLWLLPSLLERFLGLYTAAAAVSLSGFVTTFVFSFFTTMIPAFGEEFSWRGYLLPRLQLRYSARHALLLHGLITWIWHLPVLLFMGLRAGGNPFISVSIILLVSILPTVMHAVVFAYIWSQSKSLAVATFYHIAFDEVRDTLEDTVGLGLLGQYWQMLVLTISGLVILWQVKRSNTSVGFFPRYQKE